MIDIYKICIYIISYDIILLCIALEIKSYFLIEVNLFFCVIGINICKVDFINSPLLYKLCEFSRSCFLESFKNKIISMTN